jgi:hypothetical protein
MSLLVATNSLPGIKTSERSIDPVFSLHLGDSPMNVVKEGVLIGLPIFLLEMRINFCHGEMAVMSLPCTYPNYMHRLNSTLFAAARWNLFRRMLECP